MDTYEHNLKNVLLAYLLDYTGYFVDVMAGIFNSQIDMGNLIAFIIMGTLAGLGIIQTIFACLVTHSIFRQAKIILNIPIHVAIKAQKIANALLEEIKYTDTEGIDHKLSESSSEAAYEAASTHSDKKSINSIIDFDADHSDSSIKRKLAYGFLKKYSWAWKLIFCVALGFALMLVYYVDGNRHFKQVREIAYIFNTTGRLEEVLILAENIQRAYFLDRNQYINSLPAYQAWEKYQRRAHEVITLMYENSASMLELQVGAEYEDMKNFLYYTMCVNGMPACGINEQKNVFFSF